jgi:acetyl-CoA acetyltransferase
MDRDLILGRPYVASPLRDLDCSTVCTGAAAMVLAVEELAGTASRPAWITAMGHQAERHSIGARDLAVSSSTASLAIDLRVRGSRLDVLELHAPFSHQELLVLDALGADVGAVNPSGGALPADPIMATGLIRIGSAARAVMEGDARRAAGHATNGPCLQHNLLCVLEAA